MERKYTSKLRQIDWAVMAEVYRNDVLVAYCYFPIRRYYLFFYVEPWSTKRAFIKANAWAEMMMEAFKDL